MSLVEKNQKSFWMFLCAAENSIFNLSWCVCPQIQSVSQESGSPSVTLVYVVKNQDAVLNGTISSGLLNQLTAELVGYFLFYPPLVIAERKYSFIFSQWDINLTVYLFHCIDCEWNNWKWIIESQRSTGFCWRILIVSFLCSFGLLTPTLAMIVFCLEQS